MTIEEIQKECKRRYPIGTKYVCAANETIIHTVEKNTLNIYSIINNSIDGGLGKGYFYFNGKFAEVISTPKTIENNILFEIL